MAKQCDIHNHQPTLSPKCGICGTPLSGPLSNILRLAGIKRSQRNPNVCDQCNSHMREGGIVEMTVLFADLSRFTEMTHHLGAEKTHEVVSAFLDMATNTLLDYGAFIDRYIGDAIMALFNVPAKQEDHILKAAAAACEIQKGLAGLEERFGMELRSSVGIATGWARVGSLGSTVRQDYSAIGEVVNLAARLEEAAQPGEVLVSAEVFAEIADHFPDLPQQRIQLKGFPEPVAIYCLKGDADIQREPLAATCPAQHNTIGLGETVFALLGAPCELGTPIKPVTLTLGLTAIGLTGLTFIEALHTPAVQYPVFVVAAVVSIANAYAVWHAHKLRRQTGETPNITTRLGKLRPALVVALSVATVLLIGLGFYFDYGL